MRTLVAIALASSAMLALATSCHDRTANDVQTTDGGAGDGRAGRLHMIVDVSTEGPPKVIGSNEGSFVELRAEPATPFSRLVEGIDAAKHLGGTKFIIVLGDKRTKPFSLPPFDPSGATPQSDTVSLGSDGSLTVNGTKAASAAAARDALGGDASSRIIGFSAAKTTTASAIVDVIIEIEKVGRPITFAVAAS
jgi:hypothetical protein